MTIEPDPAPSPRDRRRFYAAIALFLAWIAFLIGLAADRGWSRSTPKMALAFLAGDAVLFAMGFVWLAFFATLSSGAVGIGASAAFAKGVLPFVLGDLIKIALAALVVSTGWTLIGRLRG